MRNRLITGLTGLVLLLLLITSVDATAASYDGYRWFQVEVSIFSNEYPEYRDAELWSPDRVELEYPERSREFNQFADFLQVEDFAQRVLGIVPSQQVESADEQLLEEELQSEEPAEPVGPFPDKYTAELRLPDFERDPFLLLPASLSDFQTTNSRLERSPSNRLLFHGTWRQPVIQPEEASPLIIRGGRQFGQHHELEGTITIRFNANEDRVVIDSNLWLADFSGSSTGNPGWELPAAPVSSPLTLNQEDLEIIPVAFGINRIVQMQQSRDMRSTEFHYLDHPAMGLVISVLPYDLPPPVPLDALIPVEQLDEENPLPESVDN